MPRVLLVSHTGAPGGSNTVLRQLLVHRPEDVEPACVFLDDGEEAQRIAALGVPITILPTVRVRQVHRLPPLVARLHRALRAQRAEVAFAHVAKAHVLLAPAARLAGVPYLWWQHSLPGHQPGLDRLADRLPADAVICSSDHAAAEQQRRSPKVPVHRVHPGIEWPPSAPPPATAPHVGLASRLQRWKRVELLLAAVPHVLRVVPDARFTVFGGSDPAIDPGYPAELEQLAASLGVAGAVRFAGHVPDAANRLGELAVLAHTADREPFGLVLLEAMARGVPVVAPRSGGPAEIVRDGTDGLLVDVEDPERFAAALVALLEDPARRAAMGAAGRERVAAGFSVEAMAASTWRLVDQVRRRSVPAPPAHRPR